MHATICRWCETHDECIDLLNEGQNWGMTMIFVLGFHLSIMKQEQGRRRMRTVSCRWICRRWIRRDSTKCSKNLEDNDIHALSWTGFKSQAQTFPLCTPFVSALDLTRTGSIGLKAREVFFDFLNNFKTPSILAIGPKDGPMHLFAMHTTNSRFCTPNYLINSC